MFLQWRAYLVVIQDIKAMFPSCAVWAGLLEAHYGRIDLPQLRASQLIQTHSTCSIHLDCSVLPPGDLGSKENHVNMKLILLVAW